MSKDAHDEARKTPDVSAALELNDVVHQRTRLGVLVVLAEVREADFPYLKATLKLTDGNLGQHIEILARHGLVSVRKGYEGKRPRTWVEITRAGEAGLAAEIRALTALLSL
ncbi:transcriptional regulator [Streptomyces sp. NPDC052287]|uniref:transcriptional regulator n=1 Tax=Streptomyces sp. NPDC052287 TaxID=3154950 RepID=UPI0034432B1F